MANLNDFKGLYGETFKLKTASFLQTILNAAINDLSEEECSKLLGSLFSKPDIKSLASRYRSLLLKPPLRTAPMPQVKPTFNPAPAPSKTAKVETPEDSKKPVPEVKEVEASDLFELGSAMDDRDLSIKDQGILGNLYLKDL